MDVETRRKVRERALGRCEYCGLDQRFSNIPHHIEHIIAKQHGGSDELSNLALACHRCNLHKGPNLSGIDPLTGAVVILFHPRQDHWDDHFVMKGFHVEGRTAAGRATVAVLCLNDPRRLELRQEVNLSGD